jgi:lipoprotein-releasing system permease protein
MSITQKTREIGILRALGVKAKRVMKIFIIEGILIGSVGSGIGVLIGWIACCLLKRYKFISLPVGVYGTDTLPVYMRGIDFILIPLGAIFIAFIASIYPSIRAAKLSPSDAIRYE